MKILLTLVVLSSACTSKQITESLNDVAKFQSASQCTANTAATCVAAVKADPACLKQ